MTQAKTSNNLLNNAMIVLIAIAFVISFIALYISTRPVSLTVAKDQTPIGVGEVAKLALSDLYGTDEPQIGYKELATLTVLKSGEDIWSALLVSRSDGQESYWQVAVSTKQKVPQVIGLPAQIPIPKQELAESNAFVDPRKFGEMSIIIRDSLSALLTGTPDLSRYTTSDSNLEPIIPAPFRYIELLGISKPTQMQKEVFVNAHIKAQDPSGVFYEMHYPLSLKKVEGRWEVVGILRAMPRNQPSKN